MVFTEFPFEIVDVDKDLQRQLLQSTLYEHDGYWVGPKKYFLSRRYKELALDVYNFEANENDVYLTGYLRTGTTMHSEMVWLIGNNLDYEKAQQKVLDDRFPHLDSAIIHPSGSLTVMDDLKKQTGQRFIKAHLPFSLLPPSIFENGSKVIYCARNPKDMLVSLYHAGRLFRFDRTEGDFPAFFRMMKYNFNLCTPYFEHVKEAWDKRNEKNVLFLFYEDSVKDKRQTVLKVAEFLNKQLTDQEIAGLVDHLSVDKFRKNKSVNLDHMKDKGLISEQGDFIRKGKAGGWRDYFVGDLAKEVDEWIAENLKDTDLKFPDV